jgi:DNA-binding MarR family transcriptional regulator
MPRNTGTSSPRKSQAARAQAGDSLEPLAPGAPSTVRVLRRFRQVFNAVKTHFRDVEKKAGLGGAQIWALSIIASRPGMGVGALARDMDIHQTTASNLVKALLQQSLVQAHREGADRRTVQLRVTPAGRDTLKRAPGPFAGVLPDALAGLDDATLERLDHDLGVLIKLLQADERAAGIPLANL